MTRFTSRTVTDATTAASVGVNVGCAWTLILNLAKYSDASEDILDSAALRDDEDAAELVLTGKVLVQAYLSEAARSVRPKAIEQTVQGEIAGVKVRGIVDLLDIGGFVFDFKTASKRPNGISAEHCLQLTTCLSGRLLAISGSGKEIRYQDSG